MGGFVIDLNARFRDESGASIVEQFNKLQQQDNLEKYIDGFEDLRSSMVQNRHVLPDQYVLDSFVGGLNAAVKPFVKAFKPKSIAEAVEYARLQEESLATIQPTRNKSFSNSSSNFRSDWVSATNRQNVLLLANNKPPLLPNPKGVQRQSNSGFKGRYIPADVRAEKIDKGLCYYCDQRYEKGHKCRFKEPQLFTVEVPGENDEEISSSRKYECE